MKIQVWLIAFVILGTSLFVAGEPEEALLGFDPVLLVEEGKEVVGDETHFVDRGRFRYYFVSPETRARFQKDPERYEIQFDGICALVGGDVKGRPNIFMVHKERVYIFASPQCLTTFEENPDQYLAEKEAPGN